MLYYCQNKEKKEEKKKSTLLLVVVTLSMMSARSGGSTAAAFTTTPLICSGRTTGSVGVGVNVGVGGVSGGGMRRRGRGGSVAGNTPLWNSGSSSTGTGSSSSNARASTTPRREEQNNDRQIEQLQKENLMLRKVIKELQLEEERLRNTQKIVLESFEREQDVMVGDDCVVATNAKDKDDNENEDDTCPTEPNVSFLQGLQDRALWLVGLLCCQSCSSFILSSNEKLLETHPVIVYFLTMLVGAGGNAGNQASVRVIRGLALGSVNDAESVGRFLRREFKMAMALSCILAAAGFLRAVAFAIPMQETFAITSALALIVFTSICLGAILPLVLKRIGVDPAHSSTTIQVVMDILGVLLTVVVSTAILDSGLGQLLIKD